LHQTAKGVDVVNSHVGQDLAIDFDTKVRHMHDFLEDGHKVKVTLQFRGREMAHPELGSRLLDNVIEQLGEGVRVETQARLEGRNMTMVLSSDKKVVKKADEKPAVKPSEKPKVVAEAVPVPAATTPEVEVSVTESGEVHAENEN